MDTGAWTTMHSLALRCYKKIMAKAKKRRQIGKLLKQLGIPSKLYRGSKFKAYYHFQGWTLSLLKRTLELSKPGTVVNDCDYLNHVVKGLAYKSFSGNKFPLGKLYGGNGKRIKGYVLSPIRVEFEDGFLSCGCYIGLEPPLPREEIESNILREVEKYSGKYPDSEWGKMCKKRYDALSSGQHITDERGVLLPEFSRSAFTNNQK